MIDYEQIKEVVVDDAKQRILGWLSRLQIPVTMWAEGGVGEACLEIGSNLWNEVSKVAVALKAFAIGESSSGTALRIYSKNFYQHDYGKGEYAIHRVTLTCAVGSGPYTLNKGDVMVSDGNHVFWLDSVIDGSFPFVLTPGSSQAFAVKSGARGDENNAIALGAITTMVTTYVGVTCSNTETSTGSGTSLISAGSGEESDERLKLRNSLKWATRNPLSLVDASYEYFALAAAPALTRVKVVGTGAYGLSAVRIYLASATNTAGSDDVLTVQADIQKRVLSAIVNVTAYAAPAVPVPLEGTIYYSSLYTEAAVRSAVALSLALRYGSIKIGGKPLTGIGTNVVPLSDIVDAIQDTTIGGQRCVTGVKLTSPSSDILLSSIQIAVPGSTSAVAWVAVAS